MSATLTIADIASDPGLDISIASGGDGADRVVMWAHSCEMADPTRWLGPHELLMTVGLCIPQGSQRQRAFIAKLDTAGLAGIVIGDDDMAPHLTKALFAESTMRKFPVLVAGKNTPFAAVGRTVAAANSDRQTLDVLLLAKLYQVAGQSDAPARRSGTQLSDLFGTVLYVVDDLTGCVVIGPGVLSPDGLKPHNLRTQRPTHMLLHPEARLDGFALVHLAQVLAVDASGILQDALASAKSGAAAFEDALDGDGVALRARWTDATRTFRIVVAQGTGSGTVTMALALAGLDTAAIDLNGLTVIGVPSHEIEHVRAILDDLGVRAAASSEQRDLTDLGGALSEAMSEYDHAVSSSKDWSEFEGRVVSLLSRSRYESAQIVETVLGPLVADDVRVNPLRTTLFCLLDNDLRWSETASQLGLHRQSLIYRMGQVEKLTRRSVRRTSDVAELWLARSAWDDYAADRE